MICIVNMKVFRKKMFELIVDGLKCHKKYNIFGNYFRIFPKS